VNTLANPIETKPHLEEHLGSNAHIIEKAICIALRVHTIRCHQISNATDTSRDIRS